MTRIRAFLRRLAPLWLRRRAVLLEHARNVERDLGLARQHEASERLRAEGFLRELDELRPELKALRRWQQQAIEAQQAYERAMSAGRPPA